MILLPLNALYEESEGIVPGQQHSTDNFVNTFKW